MKVQLWSEQEPELIAANARIGIALAQFFLQISITGIGGTANVDQLVPAR
jgi:outer membrane protein TolC